MTKPVITKVFSFAPIGRGGFSSILLGYSTEGDLILKIINPAKENLAILDPNQRKEQFEKIEKDFLMEKRLTSSIRHKNIIKSIDYEWLENERTSEKITRQNEGYICYELADQTLESLSNHRTLSIYYALYVVRQIAKALAYLHSEALDKQIIIHGDVKPNNIFICQHGQIKLGDFGSAQIVLQFDVTQPKTFSPVYMAPEVEEGMLHSSSDIWACGIILLELLIGRKKLSEILDRKTMHFYFSSNEMDRISNQMIYCTEINKELIELIFAKLLVENGKRLQNGNQLLEILSSKYKLQDTNLCSIIKRVEWFEREFESTIECYSRIRHQYIHDSTYWPNGDLHQLVKKLDSLINSFEENDFDFLYCLYAEVLLLCAKCVLDGRAQSSDRNKFLTRAINKALRYLDIAITYNPENAYYEYTKSELEYFSYLHSSRKPERLFSCVKSLVSAINISPRQKYVEALNEKNNEISKMLNEDNTNAELHKILSDIGWLKFKLEGPDIKCELVDKKINWLIESRIYKLSLNGIESHIPNYKTRFFVSSILCDGTSYGIDNFKNFRNRVVIIDEKWGELSSEKSSALFKIEFVKAFIKRYKTVEVAFSLDTSRIEVIYCHISTEKDCTIKKGLIVPFQGIFIDYEFIGKIRLQPFVFSPIEWIKKIMPFLEMPENIHRYNVNVYPHEIEFSYTNEAIETIKNFELNITPQLQPGDDIIVFPEIID